MPARLLKAIFDFYLFANVHMALCAVALVLVTQSLFGYTLRTELLVFVFCGTFFLYNLQRLPSAFDRNVQPKFIRHRWNTEHRVLLSATCVIAAVAAGWSFLRLYPRSQLVALLPAVISLAYAFPVIPGKGRWKRLREIPVIKIFLVALVWAVITALLPAAAADPEGKQLFFPQITLWFAIVACLIFALTIPFDIRDLHYDGTRLRTLPRLLGVKGAIALALTVLALSAAGVFALHRIYSVGTMPQVIAYFAWCVITGFFIARSTPEKHEYYFSFTLDGLLIVLWGMIAGAKGF